MTLTFEAVYENGVLKPAQPLPLKEHEQVHVTVHPSSQTDPATDAVQRSYGLIGWKGDHETLERILAESEEGEDLS